MSVASCYNEAIDKKSFLIVGPIAGLGLGFIVSPSPDIFTGLVIGVVGAMVGLAAGVGIYYGGRDESRSRFFWSSLGRRFVDRKRQIEQHASVFDARSLVLVDSRDNHKSGPFIDADCSLVLRVNEQSKIGALSC